MTPRHDIETAMRLERELQTRACRNNPQRLMQLLAADFEEVGASGRVWDRAGIVDLLGASAGEPDIQVHDLVGRVIGDGFVIVRWDSTRDARRSRRTSLWRHDATGWRLVQHQGTVLA